MEEKQQYGKRVVTEVKNNQLTETSQSIIAGEYILPRKIHTEESVKVYSRADQDAEYIRFADEEERLQKTGKLLEAEFQIKRTPASIKSGARYAIKKFTVLDSGSKNGV